MSQRSEVAGLRRTDPRAAHGNDEVELVCSEVRLLVDDPSVSGELLRHLVDCDSCRSYAAEVTCD